MKTIEILLSALLAFVLVWIWYGKLFKSSLSVKEANIKISPGQRVGKYFLIFVSLCAVAYFMNNGCLETHINGGSIPHGCFHGALYGLSYGVPVLIVHHLLNGVALKRILIDSGFAVLSMAAIGGSLAALKFMEYTF